MCGAAVMQMCEGVCVDSRGDVGVRSQGHVVAIPLFVAGVRTVRLHLRDKTRDEHIDHMFSSLVTVQHSWI